jgi:hypothetical protein
MNVKKKIRIITETYLHIRQFYDAPCECHYLPETRTNSIVVRSIFGEVLLTPAVMSLAPKALRNAPSRRSGAAVRRTVPGC